MKPSFFLSLSFSGWLLWLGLSGLFAQSYPNNFLVRHDTVIRYEHDLASPVPDSTAVGFIRYEANGDGKITLIAERDLKLPPGQDSISRTENRYGAGGLLVNRLQYRFNVAQQRELQSSRFYFYQNGQLQREERLQYDLLGGDDNKRYVIIYNSDGLQVRDSVWSINGGIELLGFTERQFQDGQLVSRLEYQVNNGNPTLSDKRLIEYTPTGEKRSEVSYGLRPDSTGATSMSLQPVDSFFVTFTAQGEVDQEFLYHRQSSAWELFYRDTFTYGPGPNEYQIMRYDYVFSGFEIPLWRERHRDSIGLTETERENWRSQCNCWDTSDTFRELRDSLGRPERRSRYYHLADQEGLFYSVHSFFVYHDSSDLVAWIGRLERDHYYPDSTYTSTTYSRYDEVTVDREAPLEEVALRLGPNPTSGRLRVQFPDPAASQLALFDQNGRLLLEQMSHGLETELDLSPFAPGVYLLRVRQGSAVSTRKVLRR